MNRFSKFEAQVICELHPLFKGLMWVAQARSEDESRYAITMIHVEISPSGKEWKLVATDGRRLHVTTYDAGLFSDDLDMIKPGLWEVITKTNKLIVIAPPEMEAVYPDWRSILPPERPYFRETVSEETISKLGIRTGVLLNAGFVTEAIGFGTVTKKGKNADIEFSADGDSPFIIRHEIGTAVVMPMRIEDIEEQEAREESGNEDTLTPDLPGFAGAMSALTDTMEEGDSMAISAGGKTVVSVKKKQGTLRPIDEEI